MNRTASMPEDMPPGDDPLAGAHNAAVELALLSVCLDGRTADAWGTIREHTAGPIAFYARNHRLLALAIEQVDGSGEPVNEQTVAAAAARMPFADAIDALRAMEGEPKAKARRLDDDDMPSSVLAAIGGYTALGDITSASGSASAVVANAKILDSLHRQRRMISALIEAQRRARGVDGSRHVAAIANDTINDLATIIGAGQGIESIGIGGQQVLDAHDQAARCGDQITGSWGVKALDDACRLTRGRLAVVAARPGCGKTSMLLQIASNTHRKLGANSVALVSREMLPMELARILLGRQLGIGRTAIERGWLAAEQRVKLAEAIAEWRTNDIPIKGHGGRGTVTEIASWIRMLHRRSAGALFLVGIDYLGLIQGTNAKHSTNDRISEITRELKALTLDLQICIVLLCQMNRESTKETRKPRLSDLRDSGSIEQDADAVVFLHSDQIEAKPAVMLVNAMVAKNRGGEEGSHGLEFLRAYGQGFREIGSDPNRPPRQARMDAPPSDAEDVTNNPPQQEP